MEQLINDNIYVVDLGEVNNAPEVIYQLSSILDKDEARNKKICLKLGDVSLNQAQLLSIKSLISGINSILSSVDTKSVETEKVALSLGIIVSNVSAENSTDFAPAMPYKLAEELVEENKESSVQTEINTNEEISEAEEAPVETTQQQEEQYEVSQEEQVNEASLQEEIVEDTSAAAAEFVQTENNYDAENANSQEIPYNNENGNNAVSSQTEDVRDELDVIFGSDPAKSSIFNMEIPEGMYNENEAMDDIVVPEHEYTKEDIELEEFPTKYIKQTIRSGQVINYEGNIVIIGDCHPGCEITAFGDITVWGVLSGIAHAGSGGNQKARVRALKMNAIQLRIANCYSRRPDSLNTVYIEKTNSFTPEEARIVNGEIVVFKIND